LVVSAGAAAEVQLRPFLGLTFGGDTTFLVATGFVPGDKKFVFGVGGMVLGEVLGLEAEFGQTPGFFTDGVLVTSSRVATFTGNVVVALPRRMARYSLRPYFVVGGGLMHPHIEYVASGVPIGASNLAVVDIGGGATGFVSERVGLNWDIRHFGSVGNPTDPTHLLVTQAPFVEQLSFWRVTTSVVIRLR
jgi:hypothetical protein